jgi:hypothetical protein
MTDIMITPKCSCHGVEMFWHKKPRPSGGTWDCKIRKNESNEKYMSDPIIKMRSIVRSYKLKQENLNGNRL